MATGDDCRIGGWRAPVRRYVSDREVEAQRRRGIRVEAEPDPTGFRRSRTRNIYVRPDDAEVWDRAEMLVASRAVDEESLSSLLTAALRRFLEARAAAQEMDRIELEVQDEDGGRRRVAFFGVWLIDPEAARAMEDDIHYAVAKTRRSRIAIYRWGPCRPSLTDYASLEEAANDIPPNVQAAARRAMRNQADVVEELDI